MKALVLSGGKGTRLRPLTHTSAKQLVPVANKPVLFYGLEAIKTAGIAEVGIIVGDTRAEIEAAVGDGSQFGLDVVYIPQEAPLGLAHTVLIAGEFLGDDDFVLYLGDNFLVGGISGLIDDFVAEKPDVQILLTPVAEPQFYGVAELGEGGRILSLQEKPAKPRSNLAIVGVYMFNKRIHEAVRNIEPSTRGELEITDAISWLIEHGAAVRSTQVSGYWKDTGRLQDMLECNRMVLETVEPRIAGDVDSKSVVTGRVVVSSGAVVRDSVIRGPVVIGEGAVIESSYVGPFTSIAGGCRIIDSEVQNSIVLENSSIDGVARVEHSLIGKDVEVVRARSKPNTHQLMLGDHSRVQIQS